MESAVADRLDRLEVFLPEVEGQLLAMQSEGLEISTKTSESDLVTQADHLSEKLLCGFIREFFPEDGIIGEEGNQTKAEASRMDDICWVLDPIDGTVNYANRVPFWAISVGLVHSGKPCGGIVSAPILRERFRAIKGLGATLNGESIQVNQCKSLRDGVIVTGFPYDRDRRADPLSRTVCNMLREGGGLRRLGAAALDFCYVADGRFVGYYEMGIKPWDAAAGSLIAEEAGASVTDLEGADYDIFNSSGVIASNAKVHDALVAAARPMLEAVAM